MSERNKRAIQLARYKKCIDSSRRLWRVIRRVDLTLAKGNTSLYVKKYDMQDVYGWLNAQGFKVHKLDNGDQTKVGHKVDLAYDRYAKD